MKAPSPLLGFNNNVRHKGRVFHIQTEDSGVRHPHIITHLFADGGRILKTTKTSYAEFIDAANMVEVVRQMMQDQHKAMFMALRDGQFDHLLEDLPSKGGAPAAAKSQPGALPPGKVAPEAQLASKAAAPSPPAAQAAASGQAANTAQPSPAAPAAPPSPAAAHAKPAAPAPTLVAPRAPEAIPAKPAPAAPARTAEASRAAEAGRTAEASRAAAVSRAAEAAPARDAEPTPLSARVAVAPTMPAVPVVVPAAPAMAQVTIADRDSPPGADAPPADRAAGRVMRPTPARVPSARPRLDIDPAAIHRTPAPHSVPAGSTLASVVEATVDAGPGIQLDVLERAAAEAETPLFQQIRDLPPPPAAVVGSRGSGPPGTYSAVSAPAPPPSTRGRYAPSRPSSIFSSARPQEGSSIFGEDLISEKSLDEVILSYLAEDLDPPGEKK
ncbi:MAG: hypothetical protein R3B70_35435 [Polyangiaceae bacterium]